VADVCRDAGLSTTASYPYFANKEALFVAAVDDDVAALIDDAVSFVTIDEEPEQWGRVIMRGLVAHVDAHPLAGRILRGLEPDFTMRLLHIPALQALRKTVTELIGAQQMEGGVRQDIHPDQTANGMVVIVISLLMATMQTGSDDGGYELVASDVESVLHAATPPPSRRADELTSCASLAKGVPGARQIVTIGPRAALSLVGRSRRGVDLHPGPAIFHCPETVGLQLRRHSTAQTAA
jgi:AcrR family transcriptional regulator